MSTRIETSDVQNVKVTYRPDPEVYFEDNGMAVGPALIIDDPLNDTATVLVGTPEQIEKFARAILLAIR